jgi:radical SAM-linked protein
MLECLLGRGGREMGKVIIDAWEKGCRLDSWSEHFNMELWHSSLEKAGITMDDGGGGLKPGSPLPWGHLSFGVDETYHLSEREKAYKGDFTSDCSEKCHICGPYASFCASLKKSYDSVTSHKRKDYTSSVEEGMYGRKRKSVRGKSNYAGLYGTRIRVKYGKNDMSRFTGHLDMVRIFSRTLRRSDIPVAYTQGYHPHSKVSFGPSLTLGMKSIAEYIDFSLSAVYPNIEEALRKSFPEGFSLIDIQVIPERVESLNEVIKFAEYYVRCEVNDVIIQEIMNILESDRIILERWTKRGEREVDIRPGIVEINVSDKKNGFIMLLSMEKQKLAKPLEVLKLIFRDNLPYDITRTEQFAEHNGRRVSPLEVIEKI